MRRLTLAMALVGFLLLTGPVAGEAPLEAELTRIERARQEAYVAGDRAALDRQLAAEYSHTNLRGERTDKAAELAFYSPGTFELHAGSIEVAAAHRYGNVATLTGTVTWEGARYRPNPNTTIDLSGRYSVSRVYVRRDGRWQLALSHASRLPEEAAP